MAPVTTLAGDECSFNAMSALHCTPLHGNGDGNGLNRVFESLVLELMMRTKLLKSHPHHVVGRKDVKHGSWD